MQQAQAVVLLPVVASVDVAVLSVQQAVAGNQLGNLKYVAVSYPVLKQDVIISKAVTDVVHSVSVAVADLQI